MKSYSSREVRRMLHDDGWYLADIVGDHYQYKHPLRFGKITVIHPTKDYKVKTLRSIFNQAGITPPS